MVQSPNEFLAKLSSSIVLTVILQGAIFVGISQVAVAQKSKIHFCVNIEFTEKIQIHPERRSKYVGQYTSNQYLLAFRESFNGYLKKEDLCILPPHDTLGVDTSNLYRIRFSKIYASEGKGSESSQDVDGNSHNVNYYSCSFGSYFTIGKFGGSYLLKTWNVDEGQSEKVVYRTFLQHLLGTNKEEAPSRVKDMPGNVVMKPCKKSAKRASKRSVRIIRKLMKKERKNSMR